MAVKLRVKSFLTVLVFIVSIGFCNAQTSKVSLELNYPITTGNNGFSDFFSGVVDVGVKYRPIKTSVVNFGASLNSGYYQTSRAASGNFNRVKSTYYTIQPRIFAELELPGLPSFNPSAGIGYGVGVFNANSLGTGPVIRGNEGFLNFNVGLAYTFVTKFFIQLQYDYLKRNLDNEVPDIPYNNNIGIIKLGLGIHI